MITEIPLERFVQDITNIYYYVYLPTHECATASGKVYMHRYVMARHIGRLLRKDEAVHHKDEDRANNDISNLELMSFGEHALHHNQGTTHEVVCKICTKNFTIGGSRFNKSKSGNFYCSDTCSWESQKRFDIDEEVLRDIIWRFPTTKIAALLGVSDTSISNRCKKFGISKPPRGYWAKVVATDCTTSNLTKKGTK